MSLSCTEKENCAATVIDYGAGFGIGFAISILSNSKCLFCINIIHCNYIFSTFHTMNPP